MNASCRFCSTELDVVVCDLGMSPLANAYLTEPQLHQPEPFYPLRAFVCQKCLLVQLEEFESPERIFGEYAYFSSYSESWLDHCKKYVEQMCQQLGLGDASRVVEVASNDGYLLQYFVEAGIPVTGIEPAANVADAAVRKGVPTHVEFFGAKFGKRLADDDGGADLLIANNVLAHVPDINDFAQGIRNALKPDGVATLEFPHLLRLMQQNQFDTIYHEHFSYFSLLTVERILSANGLAVFDVEELTTHGGSLRLHVRHAEHASRPRTRHVAELLQKELEFGLGDVATYLAFAERIKSAKLELLEFVISAKRESKRIAAYGAPAKGNTLLNYCGIGRDFIDFTVDRSPAKQGRYLPGTHIPIYEPERLFELRPDYVLLLPWNLRDEIVGTLAGISDWGGRVVVPIPSVEVIP